MEGPLVIVAAHPDDETVGAGGLLLRTPGAVVVHLTDGAPRDPRFRSAPPGTPRDAYARLRAEEARAALAEAGVARIVPLGAVDLEAADAIAPLARALADLLRALAPALVITHPLEGGHPDHDAAAVAVHAARALLRARAVPLRAIVEMTSYHLQGGALVTGAFLPGPPAVTFALSPGERAAKRRMLDRYASQRDVLTPFGVEVERFRRAPPPGLDAPPHPGMLNFERMGWSDWPTFRARARAALDALALAPGDLSGGP